VATDILYVKEEGNSTVLSVIDALASFNYGNDYYGSSSHFGPGNNQLAIHLAGESPDQTDALSILGNVKKPTCTDSGLVITVNEGTYIVNAQETITADVSEITYIMASILQDTTSGLLEFYVFTKTTGSFAPTPAGTVLVCDLKQYSTPANGVVLTEINNFID